MRKSFVLAAGLLLGCLSLPAQKQELGLTLGRLSGPTRSTANGVEIESGSGTALQANYGYRFAKTGAWSWIGEVHFLANGLREFESSNQAVTRDVATIYVTPGLRVKYTGLGRIQPYGTIGGGYALHEQSLNQINGQPNSAPRFTHRGTFAYGGGVDIPVWRWIGARFEVRDFYSGNPSFNVPVRGSGQHNVVVGGGFVLLFGRD
jgi:opacity protein-like surface antigen